MTTRIEPQQIFEKFLNDFTRTKCLDKENYSEMGEPLLDYFYVLGRKMGFIPWAKHKNSGPRKNAPAQEYMVDVCWEAKGEVVLEAAMEIEVSDQKADNIMYDFEKLTDIKAFIKIGLCAPQKNERNKILKIFGEKISKHRLKLPQEKYLIILLSHKKVNNKWILTVSGYTFNKNGESILIGEKDYPWRANN